ncbi:hypothetical protein BDQ17DRAFT_1356797 [Cyathus striatus]|nr:hypothetical protein BDQ17DRAFT_1356797 [Cyathus striatus]
MKNSLKPISTFPDRFAYLLFTNSPPNDIQRQGVLHFQAEIQTKIAALESEIKAIDERHALLVAEKDMLMKDNESCSIVTAPIKRLPFDILVAIFEQVPNKKTPDPLHSPLLLCQVCREWRNTAIHMPWLWRSLSVCIEEFGSEELTQRRYIKAQCSALLWFLRAKELPLDVKLELYFGNHSLRYARAFLHAILLCQQSIRTFELQSTNIDQLLQDLLPYQPEFPKLTKLLLSFSKQLHRRQLFASQLGRSAFNIFHDAPKLKLMICRSQHIDPILMDPLPSYWSLTCLIIEQFMNIFEWVNNFRQLPQLHTGVFHLEGTLVDQSSSEHSEGVSFENLKQLYIYHKDCFPCLSLLSLEFPVLEDFRLSFGVMTGPHGILYSKIPEVRHLAIRCQGIDFDLGYITPLKNKLKRIEEFECIIAYHDFSPLLKLLRVDPALPLSAIMFPRMKRIKLRIMSDGRETVFPKEDIKLALSSRWEASQNISSVFPLQNVDFNLNDDELEMFQEEFEDLIDDLKYTSEEPSVQHFNCNFRLTESISDHEDMFISDMQNLQEEYQQSFSFSSWEDETRPLL